MAPPINRRAWGVRRASRGFGGGGGVDIEENELRGRSKEACRFTRRKLRLCGVEARKAQGEEVEEWTSAAKSMMRIYQSEGRSCPSTSVTKRNKR